MPTTGVNNDIHIYYFMLKSLCVRNDNSMYAFSVMEELYIYMDESVQHNLYYAIEKQDYKVTYIAVVNNLHICTAALYYYI
jgi:hypothetical protein